MSSTLTYILLLYILKYIWIKHLNRHVMMKLIDIFKYVTRYRSGDKKNLGFEIKFQKL
jgi:hypothetical protein